MTDLGEFLAGLPPPLGTLVTGSLPLIAGAGLYLSVNAFRTGRRGLAAIFAALGVVAVILGFAFYSYASGRT